MGKPAIALAMIVKNEAENLPRLFESIKGCFDEIHITDTGSTDGTIEIAKAHGAKVHHFTWVNDFSAARNASFEPVKTDYVMWLDGDDVLERQEHFKLWRDNAMHLFDYWAATYNYSSDANGKPTCSFARERVFKTKNQLKWKYFVHEGILPIGINGMVSTNYVHTWNVKHCRTESDLLKDRSRNLDLFKAHSSSLDARMTYYYGKELFENKQPFEAVPVLMKACADPALEIHDRIIAIQYVCWAYILCNQFERAIDMAHSGLQLAPNRAEFHNVIGDCYLKMNRIIDAVPFFAAAKESLMHAPAAWKPAVFTNEESYTTYPRNQLSRIYANIGDFDSAEKVAMDSVDRYNHPESHVIMNELTRVRALSTSYKSAKPCDDIVFTTPPVTAYEFDPGVAKDKAMGGSETALIEMAHWLHKLSGRSVKVFSMRSDRKTFDGVEYIPVNELAGYFMQHKPFLHVAWRHSFKLTDAPTVVWSHDLMTQGVENVSQYDKVLCLTPFHKRYMMATQGVPEDKILVTRNGIKPERFLGEMPEKDPNRFVFGSSPDRGLERAMRVLDVVRKTYPGVKLHVHYGIEHLPRYGHQALHDRLRAAFEERKDWVIYHGATQQDALMESYKKSAYCIQPSDWIETSMISARELLYCGVYTMIRKVGGVQDTLADADANRMADLIDSQCETELEYQEYAEHVLHAMKEEAYKRVKADPNEWSWESVAKQWLAELPTVLYPDSMRSTA